MMSIFDDVNKWEKNEGAELISSMLSVYDPVILDYGCITTAMGRAERLCRTHKKQVEVK